MDQQRRAQFILAKRQEYIDRMSKARTKTIAEQLPKTFMAFLSSIDFADISHEQRAEIIGNYMYQRKFRISTAIKYFTILKRSNFMGWEDRDTFLGKDKKMRLDSNLFMNQKPPQRRVPQKNEIMKFLEHCKNLIETNADMVFPLNYSMNPDTEHLNGNDIRLYSKVLSCYAVKFGYLTGLRIAELRRITNRVLEDLMAQKQTIVIKRKMANEWNVGKTYSRPFVELLRRMGKFFEKFLNLPMTFDLFPKMRTLDYAIVELYKEANDYQQPPIGFGFHTLRKIAATQIVQRSGIEKAKTFLGHKSLRTTKHYIDFDLLLGEKELKDFSERSEFIQKLTQIVPHGKPIH